jgi:class 3 adenylate cyclase
MWPDSKSQARKSNWLFAAQGENARHGSNDRVWQSRRQWKRRMPIEAELDAALYGCLEPEADRRNPQWCPFMTNAVENEAALLRQPKVLIWSTDKANTADSAAAIEGFSRAAYTSKTMPSDPTPVSARSERKLATILVADVVGYSGLMGRDEEGTHNRLQGLLRDVIQPTVDKHHGRIVKTTGDGLIAEFASAVNAVQCAVALQHSMAAADPDLPESRRIVLRIGVT